MISSNFLRGVSAGALALFCHSSSVYAQQSLPTIDVGGARSRPAAGPAPASGGSRAGAARTAPATTVAATGGGGGGAGFASFNPPNGKIQLDVRGATGSRLGLTPRETPSSITILDNATIRQRGADTTQQALSQAPGVIVSSQPGSAGTVCMRGFCGAQITQLFNGVSVQYDVIAARPIDVWLTDRIEVLGGPASFLWGQGAVGGAINYVSKVANREQKGHEIYADGGMWGNRRFAYGYNGQIGNTPNWIQIAGAYKGSNGWVERTPHSSGVGSLSWLTEITPQLSNTVAVEFQSEERDSYWGTPLLNPTFGNLTFAEGSPLLPVHQGKFDPGLRFKNYNSRNPVFDQQVLWVRDIAEYRLSDATQFKNLFYFYRADRQYENVEVYRYNATNQLFGGVSFPPNTLINRSDALYTRHIHSLVGNRAELVHQDNILGFPTKFSGGIDVSWNDQTRNPSTVGGPRINTVLPYAFSPVSYGEIVYPDGRRETGPVGGARNQLHTIALFAENRTELLPKLNLVTGIRWEDISLSRTNYRLPTPPSAANPFGDPAYFAKGWQPLTWRAALMYDIKKDMNVYVTYSTAADPAAGILLTNNAGGVRNFDLTTGWQVEAGTKFDFLDGRGSMTIAGYFIERKNLTTRDPNNPQNQLPVGQQSANGVEVNGGIQITPEISVQGNLAWTNPKFDKFIDPVTIAGRQIGISRAGNRPTNVPRWVANAFLTWKFMPGWEWYFSGRFVSDRFADTANSIRVPAYTTFDTALNWTVKPDLRLPDVTLTARLRNITDAKWIEWATPAPMYIIGQPRTFEVAVSSKF